MNNDNNSGLSAFVMSAIPLKFKLYILAGIIIFFIIILIPACLVLGVFGGNDDYANGEETSSEGSAGSGGTTGTGEIEVISKDGLTFPKVGGKVRYAFCYPVSDFIKTTAQFGQSGIWAKKHTGTDFVGKTNCSVVAVADGIVNYAGWNDSYGNYCIVMHVYMVDKEVLTFYTQYCHMQNNTLTVSKGDKVVQGQKLGLQGTTGRVTGKHCHLEFSLKPPSSNHQLYSNTKDPMSYLYGGKVFENTPKTKQKYWEQGSSSQSKPQMMKPTN